MKGSGLSRQITLSMMVIAFSTMLLIVITSYVFYYFASTYWSEYFPQDEWVITLPELIWLISTILLGLIFAVIVAIKLSRRILTPLNSVADNIRRLAQGDLDARAISGSHPIGEVTLLVDDFNMLADKLQQMTKEQSFWNAAIAHELRTPVTILQGRLQGLADGIFKPDISQFTSLLSQVEGLSRLIEDLRVVSLVESGHLALHWQQVIIATELKKVVDFFSEALLSAGQKPLLNLDDSLIYCDPIRIRQALLALLENARRHAVPGTVKIQGYLENGNYHLSVEDDGPGVTDEILPYIFQAFRRKETPHTHSSGSGLGLAVVSAIARAHGGTATCNITSSGGAQFSIVWPAQPKIK
ncbi:sensor histidine kinase [Entomomonas moraniae]|uniref:histidine kinase n=1 Tax=Entomomonas moraniae TaxID=2213226 RepID=A0A3S9XCD8_9GAMM|nr:ATP-binding protein [Entomomonas moraniae]AZS50089.1 sensor histidine kinase [Entomomonas moraniae]